MDFKLKNQLDNKPSIRKHLFEKGFLITDDMIGNLDTYPFYGNWNTVRIDDYNIITFKTTPVFVFRKEDKHFFLIGHA